MLIAVTPSCRGTAVLIAPTLVVTAGHVVQPRGRPLTPPGQIRLRTTDGGVVRPTAVVAHHRWSAGYSRAADMAVLRLGHALPDDMVTEIREDAAADALEVSISGFGLDGTECSYDGSITRLAGDAGYDVFLSSDLTFADGISGGPILDDDEVALGIATWCPEIATPNSFIGIPFLTATLGWLRQRL